MAEKKQIEIEFMIRSSVKILYQCLSTSSGLSEWFADDVTIKRDEAKFVWEGNTEEATILNLPAATIRQAHERPEGMEETTVIMSGLRKERVLQSVEVATIHHKQKKRLIKPVSDYEVDNVSKKIVRIIISYVDYVNRTVWHKGV